MKTCSVCKIEKRDDEFGKRSSKRSGWSTWCKECHYQRTRQWKKDNPDKVKNIRLLSKFNISLERYQEMLSAQNGLCAICKQKEVVKTKGEVRQLAVDHDRTCCPGEKSCGSCVRGLLCQYCNTALGLFGEDKERIKKAISYLENNQKERA